MGAEYNLAGVKKKKKKRSRADLLLELTGSLGCHDNNAAYAWNTLRGFCPDFPLIFQSEQVQKGQS